MKIECVKSKITYLVSKIEKISGKNQNLPILSCLLLKVENGNLFINATNLDLGVKGSFPVRVFMEGRVAVPAGVLGGFLSQLPDGGNILFEIVGGNLVVSTKHTKTIIKTLNSDEFPTIPEAGEGSAVTLPSQDFVKGLQSVWYSSTTSSMKPELASVCVYGGHKEVVFVATDSFRLAEKKVLVKKPADFQNILIPFKNVVDIIRVFDGYKGDLEIMVGKNQVSFSGSGLYVVSRIVEGTFPDYQQIMPQEFKTEVVLLKQDLVSALKISNIFSGSFHQTGFKMIPAKKVFEVTSESAHVGKNTIQFDAVLKGEELMINFNHRYIIDCFQSIPSDSIMLGFNGIHKPLVLRGVGDKSFTYLVMPMNK